MGRRGAKRPAEPVEVVVEDLEDEGRGVARIGGKVTFVHGALSGERVIAQVRKRRRQYDEAALVEVLEASPDRVAPRCEAYERCGGCALQHFDPRAQRRHKQARLLAAFSRIGGVQPETVLEPIHAETYGYRRRARLAARWVPGKEATLVGFRERHSSYIADMTHCDTLHPSIGSRIGALRALLTSMDARDRIPQVEIAVGDDATACVVRHLDPLTEADRERLVAFARAESLEVHVQPGGPDTVAALEPDPSTALTYRLDGLPAPLRFGPSDFVQVHAGVNRALVRRVLDLLELEPSHAVLDLFCGLGNFTVPIASRAGRVLGVEGIAALVRRADENAAAQGFANAGFRVADLTGAAEIRDCLTGPWDRLLLDPPRSGAEAVVSAIGEDGPARIVYVSCHPATLARDAAILVGDGYRLAAAGIVDMFPHTAHVESVAVFTR